jgi:DNA-directed RNA polymerase specialized sigma24 family protein
MSAPTLEATTPTEHPVASPSSTDDDLDHALDIYLAERRRLFRIAYQILQDVAGAEDVLQEVWLRWQLTYRPKVESPAAYLTTTTTHLALNVVQSARHRHETPTEPHLIKPDDRAALDPSLCAEQTGAIEDALALLMSRLTPDGLAAYVLRKASATPTQNLRGCFGSAGQTHGYWSPARRAASRAPAYDRFPSNRTAASSSPFGPRPAPATSKSSPDCSPRIRPTAGRDPDRGPHGKPMRLDLPVPPHPTV